jgi:uncharacterized protein YecT (DUF1311 family)
MPKIVSFTLGIVFFSAFSAAQAASFECAKAQSNAEHFICNDSTISKLDDDLGSAYLSATNRANSEEKKRLLTEQKHWIKHTRDICVDEACFKNAYSSRLSALASAGEPIKKAYPPYPDMWQWELPKSSDIYPGSMSISLLDNGDVLILYAEKSSAKNSKKGGVKAAANSVDRTISGLTLKAMGTHGKSADMILQHYALFGGQTVTNAQSNVEIERGQVPNLKLSDGSIVHIVQKTEIGGIHYPDGTVISGGSANRADCYWGPANYSFSKRNQEYKTFWGKYLFVILAEPVHFQSGMSASCPEGKYPDLIKKVEAVSGELLPLPDGTFLINTGSMVLRFDQDFNSKASVINQNIFVLDADAKHDLVPEIANRKHRDYSPVEAGGPFLYQEALDDLYQYLIEFQIVQQGKTK